MNESLLSRMTPHSRKIILGSVVAVLFVAVGAWWYLGFSLDFMKFFAAELTPTPTSTPISTPIATQVSCAPVIQTVKVGVAAALTATGGNSVYRWIAPGGTPADDSANPGKNTFKPSYAKVGTKKVLVESSGNIVVCTVIVTP